MMETRTDYLLDGRVKITQSSAGYRAGMDAVMLAAACPAAAGESVLELGCGAGAAILCLAARVPDLRITGLEIQPDQAELARLNFGVSSRPSTAGAPSRDPGSAALTRLARDDNFEILTADIRTHNFPADHFDHVMMNPPYHDPSQHPAPDDPSRATAFMTDDLAPWFQAARRSVKAGGSVTIIHRADALQDILENLGGFGAIEVIAIHPRAGEAANRVIVRAVKGRKTPLRILPPIILHEADGEWTAAAQSILREGRAIPRI